MTRSSLENPHTVTFKSFDDDTVGDIRLDDTAATETEAGHVDWLMQSIHEDSEIMRTSSQSAHIGGTVLRITNHLNQLIESDATDYQKANASLEVSAALNTQGELPDDVQAITQTALNEQYPPSDNPIINDLNQKDRTDRLQAIRQTDTETTVWEALHQIQTQREGDFDEVIIETGEKISAHNQFMTSLLAERAEQDRARAQRMAEYENGSDQQPTQKIDMSQLFDD